MKVLVYHDNASGDFAFTRTGDAYAVDAKAKIFAVADSPLRHLVRNCREYPQDDHGYEAASIFCNSFVQYSQEALHKKTINDNTVLSILKKVNKKIREYNLEIGKSYNDPLNYDLAETVGFGAFIHDFSLYYGGLEDCYINVLRGKNLQDVVKLKYQIVKASKYIDYLSANGKLASYFPPELQSKLSPEAIYEPCWCNYLRNNSNVKNEKDEMCGWGCFTGDETAEDFFQSGSVKLLSDDIVLLFSDGMIPFLEDNTFVKWLIENFNTGFHFAEELRKKIMQHPSGSKAIDKEKTLLLFKYHG